MMCQSKVEATFLDNPAVSFFQPSQKKGRPWYKKKGEKNHATRALACNREQTLFSFWFFLSLMPAYREPRQFLSVV